MTDNGDWACRSHLYNNICRSHHKTKSHHYSLKGHFDRLSDRLPLSGLRRWQSTSAAQCTTCRNHPTEAVRRCQSLSKPPLQKSPVRNTVTTIFKSIFQNKNPLKGHFDRLSDRQRWLSTSTLRQTQGIAGSVTENGKVTANGGWACRNHLTQLACRNHRYTNCLSKPTYPHQCNRVLSNFSQ